MLSIPFILNGQASKGYTVKNDTTYFVFDERDYGAYDVKNVTVTGTFRAWSQKMDDHHYNLSKAGENIWILPFHNPSYKLIPPGTEFKFRINEGVWLDPPSQAPNTKGGNLVFLHDVLIPTLKAEITESGTIWIKTSGFERSLKGSDYVLTDAQGNVITIDEVLPNTAAECLLKPSQPIDKRRVYFLDIPDQNLRSWCSYDGWFRNLYSSKELGANISEDATHTIFRIFSPRADMVKLYLYKNSEDENAYQIIEMNPDEDMVWEAKVNGNLKGVFYDFTVHGPEDPGNHFYETLPKHISDPYARVNMEAWGKSMVWEKTIPASPLKAGIPPMQDVIAYEVHVQDFTDRLPVDDVIKGTFEAMVTPGLKNSRGEKIGFDHILDLGINTVHLMPVQEYMHHPDDIWKASFKDDPYMIQQGIAEENYQWGYRTSHAMAIENKYRKRSTGPGEERNQFRDLVQAFHDKGIAVIVDIVPNHTAEDMDGNWFMHMNVLDKIYYYRTRDLEHIGEYGNEVKTENRPMAQKWLIDQCLSLINEIGIDGFRIDLAGQIDQQTLIKLKDAIGHDKILYGEAWIASNDPDYENNPDWDWYKADSPITFFQDDSRNAFKGPVFDLASQKDDRGWPGGKFVDRGNVMRGLSCTFPEDVTTTSGINYLDIHDNWALADQFAWRDWDGRKGVDHDIFKMAATLLYTSVGPIVTHGGTEFMRSKGHAPLMEVVKTLTNGVTMYWHGKRDTYNCRTANQFVWENIGRTRDSQNSNDYKGMLDFWKGLNRFRMSEIGKTFRIDGATPDHYYEWITPDNLSMLGYIIDQKILVLMNAGENGEIFSDIEVPDGKWAMIGCNNFMDHTIEYDPDNSDHGEGGTVNVFVSPKSFKVWVKK